MFKILNERFKAHISISCSSKCLTISVFQTYKLSWTKIATPPSSYSCLHY